MLKSFFRLVTEKNSFYAKIEQRWYLLIEMLKPFLKSVTERNSLYTKIEQRWYLLIKKLKPFLKLVTKKNSSHAKIDQLRYLSQSALIEETATPYAIRTTLFLISVVVIAIIIWAGFTQVDEIATTDGEVIPIKHIQSIQHLEGGIVSEIKVVEGELVEKGQTLIVLDGTAAKRDLAALQARETAADYKKLRLKSFINNTTPNFAEIEGAGVNEELIKEQLSSFNSMVTAHSDERDVIIEQITQKQSALDGLTEKKKTLEQNIKLVEEEKDLKEQLYKKGHLSKLNFLEIQKQLNDITGQLQETEAAIVQANNAIIEYKNRLESLNSTSIDEAYKELNIVEAEETQINEGIKKLEEQVSRLEIKSPSYGYVKVLNIKTIGGVIEPGKIIAEVVPLEGNLIVETHIQPKDIGHIKVGLPVKVKIGAYDYSRYGSIGGELIYISATTFVKEDGTRYYMGRVSLAQNHVGSNPKLNLIVPGMTAEADIVTGSKSILAYLLKPIRNSVVTAFSER
jgi:membrane fusion protein, adhesin transport system